MNDMSSVIVPKSDQINSDDLIGGPMTITIRDVVIRGGQEQPVSIAFEGSDKAFRPCKSMSRVLVAAWGADAKNYIGRSLTLYRDPTVKWGGMEVGGIRISHMTDIANPMTMALTATKGSRKPYTVKPLDLREPAQITEQDVRGWIMAAQSLDELANVWKRRDVAPFRDALAGVKEERKAALSTPEEGPSDEQRGEGFVVSETERDILDHLSRKMTVIDVNSLVTDRVGELDGEGQQRVREAAFERIEALKN